MRELSSHFRSLSAWVERNGEKFTDAVLLVLALNAYKVSAFFPIVPGLAQAATLVGFAMFASSGVESGASLWRRYLRLLPGYLLTALAGAFAVGWWFNLPPAHSATAALWLGLTLVLRLARLGTKEGRILDLLRDHRVDILAGDVTLVCWLTFVAPRWSLQPGPGWLATGLLCVAWVLLHWFVPLHDPATGRSRAVIIGNAVGLIGAWGLLWLVPAGAQGLPALVFACWLAIGVTLFRLASLQWASDRHEGPAEVLRWIGLLATVGFFFAPFARAGIHGTGDALYYATFLADALTQFRAGIFPVFVGQSEYQFNGSIIPIRVAPGFQHLGGIVDVLTGRTLNPMAVQNLLVTGTALATTFSAYVCAKRLRPGGFSAWAFAVLFVTCPGVMGLAYNMDLYMSWLTAPWVPVVFALALRSFSTSGARLYATLGFALGVTWWLHPPIALWLVLTQVLIQLVRLVWRRPNPLVVGREIAAGAMAFLATAGYPLVSALLYPANPAVGAGGGFVVPANHILQQLLDAFPAAWLPLSELGRKLGDYQLGYGLIAATIVATGAAWRTRDPGLRSLLAVIVVLLLLVIPVPGLNLALWQLVPAGVRTVTNTWAMQRLYLVLAGCTLLLVAAAWRHLPETWTAHRRLLLAAACLWSCSEAAKFLHGSHVSVTSVTASAHRLAPENITLTRYSYGLFARKPAYFTHGVTDPTMENRLLRPDLATVVDDNYTAAARQASWSHDFPFVDRGGHFEVEPRPEIEPGRRYLVALGLSGESRPEGSLVLEGDRLQRVYGLPEYGEARAFGFGPENNQYFPLRTTGTARETVRVLFQAAAPVGSVAPARLTLLEYDPDTLPVRVGSLLPYRASVRASEPLWLETPRAYQPGYVARVGGRPAEIRASAEGLVCVPVPIGESQVEIEYLAPPGLQAAFWVSLVAIIIGLAAVLTAGLRTLMAPPAATVKPAATGL